MHIEGPGLTIIEGQQCVRIVWYPSTIKFTHSLNVQSEKTNFTRIVPGNSLSRLYRLILIQDNYTGDVRYVSVIFIVDNLANIFFVI